MADEMDKEKFRADLAEEFASSALLDDQKKVFYAVGHEKSLLLDPQTNHLLLFHSQTVAQSACDCAPDGISHTVKVLTFETWLRIVSRNSEITHVKITDFDLTSQTFPADQFSVAFAEIVGIELPMSESQFAKIVGVSHAAVSDAMTKQKSQPGCLLLFATVVGGLTVAGTLSLQITCNWLF